MKILQNIKKNRDKLSEIKNGNSVKTIIINADKSLITAICDCIYNIINGNVSIDSNIFSELSKKKNILREITHKSSLKNKKHLLLKIQHLLPKIVLVCIE